MASITLKDLPKRLHSLLREKAKLHGRSLNREIIAILESSTGAYRQDPRAYLVRIREVRQHAQLSLRQKDIERAISDGRP